MGCTEQQGRGRVCVCRAAAGCPGWGEGMLNLMMAKQSLGQEGGCGLRGAHWAQWDAGLS